MRVSSLVNDRTNGIRGRKKLAHIATLVVALVFQTISFEPAHAALTSWKLTATAATYVQGGTAPTLTATSNTSGSFQPLTLACGIFAAADTGFATPLSFSAALTAGTAAYKIHCTATAASGYATTPTTNTSGTLTVKIPWTSLTATAASYTQGGTAPTLTATSDPTGAKGTLTCRVYAATDTGYVNAVTPSASMSLTANFYKIHCTAPAATNYVSTPTTNTDADLTVNPPTTWTLTATAASYVQGGTAPALTGTASPGAAITGSSTCRVYAVADTGYVTPVTLSASLTVGNTDYVIHCTATAASGYASAPGTNTDAALTVTVSTVWTSLVATAATYVPGGTPPTLTGVATPSAAMTGAPTCQVYLATDTGFATPKTWAAVTVTGSTTYKIRCTGTAATGYNSTPTTNTTAWLTVPIAWAITPAIANYSQGGVVPIFKGAASPAAGLSGSLTCNAYAAADTGFATPLTLTASTATGNTYIVRCTGTAASGYAATPTINTAVLTVVANLSLTCNANFYQVGAGLLYKLTYTAAASPPFAYAAFGSSSTSSLNSIGWNPDDNYVYGAVSGNLYRIASNQTITNLGPTINAAGTATSPQNTGGDFYRINGTAYLMGGSGTTFTLTNVASRVVTSMTVSSGSWSPYDMTIIGNTAWGYDGTTLYKGVITSDGTLAGTTIAITSKAGVTGTVRGTTTSSDRYGAMYSDSDGNLYMFSNTGADLFEITAAAAAAAFASPATTPAATFIVHALTAAGTAISSPNDGASCPNASSPTAPTLTTTAGASSITLSGGHIAGTITTGTLTGSNIASGSLQFCYALTELLLASSLSCVNSSPDIMATGQTSAAISVDLSGLSHGTLYYFRAKASNTLGAAGYGGTQSFTTLADWTLTASGKGYTIGGTAPTLVAVAAPVAGLSGSATCRAYAPTDSLYATPLTVNASLAAGDYTIHCTGTGASGYASTPTTNVDATLRVTALISWTVEASPATYVLHSTIPTLSGGASPFAGLNGALTCQAFTTLDTGFTTPKTVDLTLAPGSYVVHCSGATTSGYAAPSVIDKVLTVTLGPWSLTAANKDYTIGGSAPSLTATASPAEALSGSATCNIYLPTDLGFVTALTINNGLSASVHYVIHCTGTAASGYAAAPTYVNAILNVTALLSWAITAADAHYTYGQTPASLSGAALPLAGLNGSLTCSAYAQSDLLFATALVLSTSTAAGTYVIHCTGTATNGYTSTPTINDAVLTVIAIGWTIAADAVAYAIGNSVPSLTGAASPAGALNGSLTCRAYPTTDLTYIGAVVVDANLPTGTYTIHCTGSPTAGYTPTPTITDHSLTVTVATHTVTYNGNTNTGGSVPVDSSSPYTYNTSATVKTNSGSLVKTGYTFNGWNTAADGSGTSRAATGSVTFTVASSDVVLYAQWAIASFTITFDLNGGNISGSTTNTTATVVYQVDAVASKPTNPTKTGYSFTGWNETGSGTALSSYAMPGVDSTLMAIWTAQPFTATYDLHGGTISGSTANPTAIVAFSADAIASKPTNPTMPGYSFSGWNLTGSGSVLTSYSMPAANTTLYAVWSAVPHVITYLVGNHWASGAVPTQIDVATAGTFTLAVSGLTGASGYRFAGWSDGTRTYHPGDTYTVALAAVNLTAMWQASSLDGIDLAKITLLGTIYANDTNASTITVTNAGTSITVNLPAGSLPAATKLDIYVQSDLTKARNLISDSASYLVSILIAWLTTDNAIPPTAVGKPITVTITNTALNTGDPVFGMIGANVQRLGTTASSGTVTFNITEDPEIIITHAPPVITITTGATQSVQAGTAITNTVVDSSTGGSVTGYTISPSLPANVTLNVTTGVISGIPTGTQSLTPYTLTATGPGGTSSATFRLTVTEAPPILTITTGATQTVRVSSAITSTVSANSGGAITSYSIAPSLPTGVSLNTSTGVISGTPTGAQATNSYTLTALGPAGGTSNATFTLTVVAAPAITITVGATQSVQQGCAITSTAVTNTGGAISSYSTTTLPANLSLNTSTGVISGTPTNTQSSTTYTLTATGPLGQTSTAIFTLTVTATPPNISINNATQSVQVNTSITNTSISNSGGSVSSYSTASLPAGLTLNTSTGVISGTPTSTQSAATYTIRATGPNGATSDADFTLTVTAAPPVISITTGATQSVQLGSAITTTVVANTGGPITGFTVSPSLPAALTMNLDTGVISGIPASAQDSTTYTVTATGPDGGTSSASFVLSVVDASANIVTFDANDLSEGVTTQSSLVRANLTGNTFVRAGYTFVRWTTVADGTGDVYTNGASYSFAADLTLFAQWSATPPAISFTAGATQVIAVGAAITPTATTNTGGSIASWSVSTLPSGLTWDAATGVISGTPDAAQAVTTYTLTATGPSGATSAITFTLTVIAPPSIAIVNATQSVQVNTAITSTSITNSGGAVASYAAVGLPSGVSINSSTGVISGTPAGTQTSTRYTVTATGTAGATSTALFTLTVTAAPPNISITTGATQSVIAASDILTTVVTNSGGAITGFTISPGLPAGLTLDELTGAISGAPAGEQVLTTYTLTATGPNGGVSNATFTLTVLSAAAKTVTFNANDMSGRVATQSSMTTANLTDSPFARTGYVFVNWTTGDDGSGDPFANAASYNFAADFSLYAQWAVAAPSITFTAGATQSVQVNVAITPTATANTGGAITSWSVTTLPTGLSMAAGTGVISGTPTGVQTITTYTLTANGAAGSSSSVTFTLTVTAAPVIEVPVYVPPALYTITYVAGSHGTLSGLLSQTISSGASGSAVTATAETGYEFTSWSDGSTTNPRIDSSVFFSKSVTATFTYVGPRAQTITFVDPGNQSWSAFNLQLSPTASSTLAVVLTSTTVQVCTVSGFAITLITTGTCTLTATQIGGTVGSNIFAAATPVTRTFTIGKASGRTIAILATSYSASGYASWSLTGPTLTSLASAGDSDTKTYAVTADSDGCSVSFTGIVTFTGAGVCRVQVSISGTLFGDATSPAVSFEVGKKSQDMVFAANALTYNESLQLKAPVIAGTGALTYSVPTNSGCSLVGDKVTANSGTGTCEITVTKAADKNYLATTTTMTITLSKASQTLTMTSAQLAYGQRVRVSAVSPLGVSGITYSLAETPSCSIKGNLVVALSGTGTCTVTAAKAGTTNYLPATSNAVITLTKAAQTLRFTAPRAMKTTQVAQKLSARATSGLTVSFQSSTPKICVVSAATVKAISTGTCSLAATQSGDANYAAAEGVSASFSVTGATKSAVSAAPVITWSAPAYMTLGDPLTNVQLNAQANVAGSFVYTPAVGTKLPKGTNKVTVVFTPTENPKSGTIQKSISITVVAPITPSASPITTEGVTPGTSRISGVPSTATVEVLGYSTVLDSAVISGPTLTVVASAAFSGTTTVNLLIRYFTQSIVLTVPVTVSPARAKSPIATPQSLTETIFSWGTTESATGYEVKVRGATVCSTTTASCTAQVPVGPATPITITTLGLEKSSVTTPVALHIDGPVSGLVVNFDTNSSVLSADALKQIRAIALIIAREGYTHLIVHGHTDIRGGVDNNALSNNRAQATLDYIQSLMPGVSFELEGYAATQPVASSESEAGLAANRRAEISVLP